MSTTKFVQRLTLTYFMARSNLLPYAFDGKKVKHGFLAHLSRRLIGEHIG